MSDRRTGSLALRVATALCVAALGCTDSERDAPFGRSPTSAPILLFDWPADVQAGEALGDEGQTGSTAGSAQAHAWHGPDLAAWTRDRVGRSVRYTSPAIGPRGLLGAGTLQLRLRPGGATQIIVIPWLRGSQVDREQRMLRRIELSLDRDAAPDAAIDAEVDLFEALHGNFGDAGRSGRLEKLEILLPGATTERAELLGAAILPRQAIDSDEPAGAIVADHHGVLRPAWFVRGGATAQFDVDVPRGAPELRWHDAALREGGARIVEVVPLNGGAGSGAPEELARIEPATGTLGAPWQLQRVSLAAFAGERIGLRLRVEGGGIGLFGEPRIGEVDNGERANERAPDVLVYMIDTLRADHLGYAGNSAPNVSPAIDELAETGARFDLALSSSPWTKPAIATLMSGILPTTHQVGAATYTDRMPAGVPLVQESFRKAGWRTGSFAASPLGSTLSALERGFSAAYPPRFWRTRAQLAMNPSASQLHEALRAWIDEEPDTPYFAYVHTLEVHEWKLARYRTGLPEGMTSYDAAILDADRQLGELLDALAQDDRDRELLVVVVSDHGESWGDHGLPSHGFGLFQSQIHIPLIFWSSSDRLTARAIPAPVSLADLAPTLLDGFGLEPLEDADGRSLVGYLGDTPPADRPVLSSLLRFVWAPRAPRQHAVTMPDRVKLIRTQQTDLAFDLGTDPDEHEPRESASARRALDRLLAAQTERAAAFTARYGALAPGAVTADATERLRALGYLEETENGDRATTPRDDPASPMGGTEPSP